MIPEEILDVSAVELCNVRIHTIIGKSECINKTH